MLNGLNALRPLRLLQNTAPQGGAPAQEKATVAPARDVFVRSAAIRKPGAFEELTGLKDAIAKAEAALKPKEAPKPEPKAEEPKKEEPPAPPPPTYTVASGDSLSVIAGRTLGNEDRWREIFDLNRDQIANPDAIFSGQVLKLPNGANAAPAPAPPPPPAPGAGPNTNRDQIYMRQPNNWTCGPTSLTMAAAAFGVKPLGDGTVDELRAMTHTTPEYGIPDNTQIPNAARNLGLQATDSRDSNPGAVRAALQAGHGVVLNGSLGTGGHFIYVAGLDSDGRFIVCDPWRPEITRWNDGELDHFAHNNPGHGGMIEIWR